MNSIFLDPASKYGPESQRLTIRALTVDDLELEINFLSALSHAALYQRVMGTVRIRSVERIRELLDYEPGPAMALGAIVDDGDRDLDGRFKSQLLGVARYAPAGIAGVAEMAIVLSDDTRGRGLATELLSRLHCVARRNGYHQMIATTFSENAAMLRLAKRLGYERIAAAGDGSTQQLRKTLADGSPDLDGFECRVQASLLMGSASALTRSFALQD